MRAVVALVEAGPETIIEDYDRVLRLSGLDRVLPDGPLALAAQAIPGGYFPGAGSPPWQLEGILTWQAKRSHSAQDGIPPAGAVVLPTSLVDGPLSASGWGWDDVMAQHGADFASDHFRHSRSFRAEPALPALTEALSGKLTLPAGLRDRPTVLMPVPALDPVRPIVGAMDLLRALLAPALGKVSEEAASEIMADVVRFAGQALPGLGVVMDGVWWQVGRRPGTRRPVARNLLLAGRDPVAVDAVAARLAGRDPGRDLGFRLMRDLGLGAVREEDIRLVGRTDLMGLDFQVPDKAVGGSALGWDKVPLSDRVDRKFKRSSLVKQLASTPWGELFEAYRMGGPVWERKK